MTLRDEIERYALAGGHVNKVAKITVVALLVLVGVNVETANAARWDQPFFETAKLSVVSSEKQLPSQVVSQKKRRKALLPTSTR